MDPLTLGVWDDGLEQRRDTPNEGQHDKGAFMGSNMNSLL